MIDTVRVVHVVVELGVGLGLQRQAGRDLGAHSIPACRHQPQPYRLHVGDTVRVVHVVVELGVGLGLQRQAGRDLGAHSIPACKQRDELNAMLPPAVRADTLLGAQPSMQQLLGRVLLFKAAFPVPN